MQEHTFDICACVKTENDWDSVTPGEFRKALLDRINSLDDSEILEAVGHVDSDYN